MQELEKDLEKNENHIKDILEKTENDIKEGKITRRSAEGGAEEFVFAGEGTGLVFDKVLPSEEQAAEDAPTTVASYEKNTPRVEEITLVTKPEKTEATAQRPKSDEFLLPPNFRVDEKYNTPSEKEERRPVYSAYIPKFTDASENYRMADEARPKKEESKVSAVDPTAEDEREIEGAVIVEVAKDENEGENVLTVSKVAAAKPMPESQEIPAEDAQEAIASEMFAQSFAASGEESAAPPIPEMPAAAPEIPAQAASEEPLFVQADPTPVAHAPAQDTQTYSIPDPEQATMRVFDYPTDAAASSLPAEAEVASLPAQRKLFAQKEYVDVGQKLAFKDMFLDRLNSVKVRLGVALLLTVILGILENIYLFGVDMLEFLGFHSFPFATAFFDMQITICLFLLAAPEIMRGVRALMKGMFRTELFLPIAFVLQMLHTSAVMILRGSADNLYGFVFGLGVIAMIGGSYLRHHAAFLTFRHVGGREEKFAVEKKMTRSLEKEKFALDGAVDEYKSKTARVLRASFIADFFARERKTSENTRHNLKYLLLSLGISLVAAIVMYFVGDGMMSGVTTLTLTFYFSAPAALLLTHRLPYYFSVRAASGVNGGVIGETSHYDYAGVDVVCFKDTEVFGKGDVSLKHIILYDAAKEFTVVVEQMSSLFAVIGGPLDVLFSGTLVKQSPRADDAVLEAGGIYGRIGDVVHHVGNAKYMISKGIALPKEKDNRESEDHATVVMYAAENGHIYAKFYLQYRLSSAFESLFSSFEKENIVSLVYTRDHNLSADFMRHLVGNRDLIRVIVDAPSAPEPDVQERVSVGLVSSKDKASALSLLLLCRRYVRLQKNLKGAFWFVLGGGAFLGVMLAIFRLLALPSIAYGLWQIALVGAMAIYGHKAMKKFSNPRLGGSEKK